MNPAPLPRGRRNGRISARMADPLPPVLGWQGQALPVKMAVPLGTSRGVALLYPGAAYPQDRPLLVATREMFVAAGCEVLLSERYYGMDAALSKLTGEERENCLVTDSGALARAAFERAAGKPVFLAGKSLGTTAMAHALKQVPDLAQFPSIWLTPLWKDEAIQKALLAAGPLALVVIGKADPQWDESIAEKLTRKKVTIYAVDGADHGMTVTGSAAATAQVLMDLRAQLAGMTATIWPPAPSAPTPEVSPPAPEPVDPLFE